MEVFILLLILLPLCLSDDNLCPPAESTSPCGCVSDGITVRLDCIGIRGDIADTRRAILSVADQDDVAIDFLLSKFDEPLPSHLFSGVKVTILSFEKCDLKGIGEEKSPSFVGLESSLKELTISFSFPATNGLKYLNLSNLEALELLQLEGNNMNALGDEWFGDNLKRLTNLYIMANGIKTIGRNVFANLKQIETIWITNNEFTTLERSMFAKPALRLTTLDLSNNKISSLPADMFANMPELTSVILDDNEIKVLEKSTWLGVWSKLRSFYINDNPLHCDSSIDWLLEIPRPNVLKGICCYPDDKSGKLLIDVIDEHQEEMR